MTQTTAPVAVPVRVDAAWSDGQTSLSPPATDFTNLTETATYNTPWLGDTSAMPPNDQITLPEGVHLHWTLPKALRQGSTVYQLDSTLFNELVQQSVPCSLVQALKNAADTSKNYTLADLNSLLSGLCASSPTISKASGFDLTSATEYSQLISSDSSITIETTVPKLSWDPVFLEIYGPLIARLATRTVMPEVPNRWLVIREDSSDKSLAWVVESDYLSTPDSEGNAPEGTGPTAIPATFSSAEVSQLENSNVAKSQLILYLGKTIAAEQWSENGSADRLSPFTALGHGIPDFAAFYPNCRGVFGFHDASAEQSSSYTYTVIGWFSDSANDPLSPAALKAKSLTLEQALSGLGWSLANASSASVSGSLYSAKITVSGSNCELQQQSDLTTVDVAIGNTVNEALSAYIANGNDTSTLGISPESLLNAAQGGVLQDAFNADGPAVIENVLHQQGFQPTTTGWQWQITTKDSTSAGLSPTTPDNANVNLSDAVAQALNTLNEKQQQFDDTLLTLSSERHLLFTDWCRTYHLNTDAMSAGVSNLYPNGESRSNNNEQLVSIAATQLVNMADAMSTASVGTNTTELADLPVYQAMSALYLAYTAAVTALSAMTNGGHYVLKRQPAPRFWRPNDPVVMMSETSGTDLQTLPASNLPQTTIDKQDYLTLSTITAASASPSWLPANWDQQAAVPSADVVSGLNTQLTATTAVESWRPLSLYWETKFQQFAGVGTINGSENSTPHFSVTHYQTDFISNNFELDDKGIDWIPQPNSEPENANTAYYRGRVILTSQAVKTLKSQILQLTNQVADPPAKSSGLNLPANLNSGLTKTLICNAYDSGATTLSQTLNGFNDRLLMLQRLNQVSIFDPGCTESWVLSKSPTWDPDSQSFYNQIGLQQRTSPRQIDIYNPIRAGKCEVTQLTLVDAFGQTRLWNYSAQPLNTRISQALPNETSTGTDAAPAFFMPPRFSQPARLMYRWLAADGSNDTEANLSPATSPICGWLTLNRIDETIMVFPADGSLVGWIPADGGSMTYMPGKSKSDITDSYLSQVVTQLEKSGNNFYDDINTALLTIEPHGHQQLTARSVLESRPLAIARVDMQLQLSGAPSPHQGYQVLGLDMDSTDSANPPYLEREDCGFTAVDFPVRLGDVSMDNDGLVLYWQVSSQAIGDTYQVVSEDSTNPASISLTAQGATSIAQALLLFDPRAPVHLSSGILPVEQAVIPPAMFADALNDMTYLMQVGPIVTPPDSVTLPLPVEANGWQWQYLQGNTWQSAQTPVGSDGKLHQQHQPAVIRQGFLQALPSQTSSTEG